MRQVPLAKYGPFGDEEDLQSFSEQIDFTRGSYAVGQVIRGFRDQVGRQDSAGVWFDRRATFLMQKRKGITRVIFEVSIDSLGRGENPTEMRVEFNDELGEPFPLNGPGYYEFETALPPYLHDDEYFHLGLRANSRFILSEGDSPRLDKFGAMRICKIRLE